MMRTTTRHFARFAPSIAATLAASTFVLACSDGRTPSGVSPFQPAGSLPVSTVARLHATVDVTTGTLTFDPVSETGIAIPDGASAAIYGDQGVSVRIYNSAVVTSAPAAGKKTYTANVGVRNLLAFRIGDEQNAATPADTMGIYVFTNSAPVVSGTSSPCTCTVTVKNRAGTLDFSSTNQAYWYWPELLGAAGSGTDTTLTRKSWVFEADTQVTHFNFDVLVSAAWASPNETIWKVDYPGDSLPDTQAEPRWHRVATSKVTTTALAGGLLEVDVQRSKDSIIFVRRDSLAPTTSAFIESTFRLDNGGNDASPQAGIAIDDNSKRMALLVSDSGSAGQAQVGFGNGAGGFIAGSTSGITVTAMHTYTLRKFGSDSVVAYVDNGRRAKVAYGALPASQYPAPQASVFEFGIVATSARNTSTTWDYVTYQIGKATP